MVTERKQENNTVCPKEENQLNQLRADVIKKTKWAYWSFCS